MDSRLVPKIANGQPGGLCGLHRIIVVDDLRDSADSLALLLRALGHEVRVYYEGAEALMAAESLHPDVMLLDLAMPGMDGFEVCRRIREQSWGKEMLMIAQTGWGQKADRRRAAAAGFDMHLTKPLDCASRVRAMDDRCDG